MKYTDKIIAFIQVKKQSIRVPNKNLRMFGDKPLFCHAIINALNSKLINKVVIDSDCGKILKIGKQWGAIPLKRPKKLATNKITGDELAYWQASNFKDSDIILQVVPTSPFIKSITIDKGIKAINFLKVDSVIGCRKEQLYIWKNRKPIYLVNGKIPNSNKLSYTIFETTGLYISKTDFILQHKKRFNVNSVYLMNLSKIESIDINTEEEFKFAELIWKGLNA